VTHNHPGEAIEDYLRRGGLLSRFSAAAALPQQIQSALSDVAQAQCHDRIRSPG
jgi:hypothetical protein